MMKRTTGSAPPMVGAILTGVLVSCGWAFFCAAVIAKLLDCEAVKMETVGYFAMAVHVSAPFIGTIVARRRAGHMAAAFVGAGYFLSLLLVNVLFFGGTFTGVGITFVLAALGTGAAVLMTGKGSVGTNRKHYKIPR